MSNPNSCATCGHKRHPDGGWCYMFRDEPTEACAQHTWHARLEAKKWLETKKLPTPATTRGQETNS